MREERIQFAASDGTRLTGIWVVPSDTPIGAVVLAHGITVDKNEGGFYTTLAEELCNAGIASLRFDFRGHGESDGRSSDMTIAGEVKDLAAAAQEVQRRFHVAPAIVAASFGGGIAVLLAGAKEVDLSALVLLNPVLDYTRTFLRPETEWARQWFNPQALREAEATGTLDLGGFVLGKPLLDEFRRYEPLARIPSLNMPVMIVHGTADSKVPFDPAKQASIASRNVSLMALEGADHGFAGRHQAVFRDVVGWLKEQMGKPGPR